MTAVTDAIGVAVSAAAVLKAANLLTTASAATTLSVLDDATASTAVTSAGIASAAALTAANAAAQVKTTADADVAASLGKINHAPVISSSIADARSTKTVPIATMPLQAFLMSMTTRLATLPH